MIKSKKQMFLIISVFAVLLMLTTVTYAFFNYTRTGIANTIRVGRISFVTRQTETINLTNVFPIEASEATGENPNYDSVVIEIEGDTDYSEGIEYLVSVVDANIYTNEGQPVPISLDITVDGLGTSNANYFNARESKNATIYKKIVGDTLVGDQMLLVGYIKPNTTSGQEEGIDGSITIKAYIDKDKIKISDTYDGTESDNMGTTNEWAEGKTVLTTTEWNTLNNVGISFKVKVEANEGIWVIGSLEEIMRKTAVMDNINSSFVSNETPGINFDDVSSDTNGKGVYTMASTVNDDYPIVYYRGAVEDNNIIFNNICWKAIRTTDTGGVKLIYNGEQVHVYKDDNYELSAYNNVTRTGNQFEFDTNTNEWKVTLIVPSTGGNSGEANIKFTVAEAGNYTLKFNNPGSGPITATRDGVSLNPVTGVNEIALNNLTTSEEINIAYTHYNAPGAQVVVSVALIKGQLDLGLGCDNEGTDTQITLNGTNIFQFTEADSYDSPAYSGYMYGDIYLSNKGVDNDVYYDRSFVWDGTSYTLTDNATTTKSDSAHYSCGDTSKTATCSSLRYYFYVNYYILLTGGDGVEEALAKMQINRVNSNAKDKIEDWYEANMTSYTNRIEDTIYCDDRSMNNINGWNANGGFLLEFLNYGGKLRALSNGTVSPSLSCTNKNDSFTWKNSNGNRKLQYPVALITSDELILAGGKMGDASTFYLLSRAWYWTLSPYDLDVHNNTADVFTVGNGGSLHGNMVGDEDTTYGRGLRPVISIKPGQLITKGNGTIANPYVIE